MLQYLNLVIVVAIELTFQIERVFGAHLNPVAVLVADEHEADDVGRVEQAQ